MVRTAFQLVLESTSKLTVRGIFWRSSVLGVILDIIIISILVVQAGLGWPWGEAWLLIIYRWSGFPAGWTDTDLQLPSSTGHGLAGLLGRCGIQLRGHWTSAGHYGDWRHNGGLGYRTCAVSYRHGPLAGDFAGRFYGDRRLMGHRRWTVGQKVSVMSGLAGWHAVWVLWIFADRQRQRSLSGMWPSNFHIQTSNVG
ncbi:MAG: hypothetical protein HJJLKODD_02067 [Phycisphaerae bacterium]|nr:hypothetical protein [Phycisphaerae bacterium]